MNIWRHYIRFRAYSDIRLLSFIIQSALQSRILFVTRLANKQHYINHPNLDFNAFHIPVDVKHLRYNVLESQNTKKPRDTFVFCSQPDPSGSLLPRSYSLRLRLCHILKRERARLY